MHLRWPAALCALGLLLVAAAPAGAQGTAGGAIANSICRITSNRVNQLRDTLRNAARAAGYTGGLSESECEKFVKKQVNYCKQVVYNGTDCRENFDKMEFRIQAAECTENESKPDRKACEQTAVLTHESNDQVSNTLQVIGNNSCGGSFATDMRNLCLLGPP